MNLLFPKARLLVLIAVLFTACANHASSDDEDVIESSGNIPLKLTANIFPHVHTRVADNRFETGDAIGVFGLAGNATLEEERYMDNLRFVRSVDNEFTAGNTPFYPDDGVSLNLLCYYPYQTEGIPMGESTLPVSVESDQSVAANYSRSCFMTVSKKNLLPNNQPVGLTFQHRFFRLNIVLVPGEGESAAKIMQANPTLSVSGFYTQARYDFGSGSFSSYKEEKSIIPAGVWEAKGEYVKGKSCILIPQDIASGYHYLTLTANDKKYITFLPSTLHLDSGTQRTLEITYKEDEDVLLGRLDAEIREWEGTETDQAEATIVHKYVDISKLTFAESHIYRILHEGRQVGEICKEYLISPDFEGQAIVAYPMKNGDPDHTQGLVVQCLASDGKADRGHVHGGTVSWNAQTRSLNYTAGNSSVFGRLYVLEDGKLTLSIHLPDKPLPVLPVADCIRDVRGGTIRHYPLVKIGTQYWLRSNLQATKYTDGTELTLLEELKDEGGYLQSKSKSGDYFYTSDVALSEKLLPPFCNLPTWDDWNILKAYVQNNASLLKAGTWQGKQGQKIQPATNLSGFTALPVGLYIEKYSGDYRNQSVGYWTLASDKASIAEKAMYLTGTSNTIDEAATRTKKKAFSIRCMVKRGHE